jgi:hypothetical protein
MHMISEPSFAHIDAVPLSAQADVPPVPVIAHDVKSIAI